ncbi:TonB-dependent receptor [Novosphingobium terrae]|uniref:TonB-dependent receptor n=1 Tax=Novosphingobium terrae TaxID=2726189 RepID=UPI00197E4A2C|nr:TonB-dependent receptor [Novosphingobium terrae]
MVNGHNDADSVTPGTTPLTAVQPTSVISADFIARNLPASGNYDEAIKFSPSVFDTAPNGPGLAESQNISIRGFQDGQFNVTFDGIPWGDSNDFTHHTTSYFMAHDLGQITVDRGPGTAATIGNATFGGTVYTLSKAPEDAFSVSPYASYGSFNTFDAGIELNTGKLNSSGTRVFVDAETLRSDGYLTFEHQRRQNIYGKLVQPIGADFTFTVVGMYDHVHQNISLGTTQAEMAQYGRNYGLSNNPLIQNYYGYNADFINTNFEYGDLAGSWGDGWSVDSKIYSYAYIHTGLNGEDPNGEYPNQVMTSPGGALSAGVPGQLLTNDYRSIGTITRLTKTMPFGDIQTGLWYDHQTNYRHLTEVVMSNNLITNYDDADTGAINGVDRDLHQTMQTLQPYLQVSVKPVAGLTLTPGVRYSWFQRDVNAIVNVKYPAAANYSNTFHSWLPSLEGRYEINPHWSAYAQVAKGFLAPNENYFNYANPSSTSYQPETTWNYQIGTTWKKGGLSLAVDAYLIDFSNLIASIGSVGGLPLYGNLGGVHYRGLEGEATVPLGKGFSVYANGSVNSALSTATNSWVPNAPKGTAAGGLIYSHNALYASFLAKWIGPRYGDTGDTQHLGAYATADISFGVDLDRIVRNAYGAKLKLNIQNVTKNTKIINLAGYTVGAGTPLYWANAGRSVFATIEFKIK